MKDARVSPFVRRFDPFYLSRTVREGGKGTNAALTPFSPVRYASTRMNRGENKEIPTEIFVILNNIASLLLPSASSRLWLVSVGRMVSKGSKGSVSRVYGVLSDSDVPRPVHGTKDSAFLPFRTVGDKVDGISIWKVADREIRGGFDVHRDLIRFFDASVTYFV